MKHNIKDHSGLVKDTENKAVLSVDNKSLLDYKRARVNRKLEKERINNLERSVKRIEEMVSVLLERIKE